MNNEIIVVEDRVDMQCMRHVHLMANAPLSATPLSPSTATSPHLSLSGVNGGSLVEEMGVWHLRWEGPYRGAIDIPAACREGKVRRLVAWSLSSTFQVPGSKPVVSVRQALHEAAREFERLFGGRARFGFMRKLPKGAEHGMEVGDLMLLEAEWALEKCVMVGGRRQNAECRMRNAVISDQ